MAGQVVSPPRREEEGQDRDNHVPGESQQQQLTYLCVVCKIVAQLSH